MPSGSTPRSWRPATTTITSASTHGRAPAESRLRPATPGSTTWRSSIRTATSSPRAIRRLLDHGYEIDHGTDHAATVSVYLEDPDGNGVELYYDRPREAWFDDDGRPILQAERIPVESI